MTIKQIRKANLLSEHQKLSRITLISGFGDYFSEFALILLLYKVVKDGFFAGLAGVGVGSIAAVGAGMLIPYGLHRIGTKRAIVTTQLLSGSVIAFLFCLVLRGEKISSVLLVLIFFFVTFSNEWFKAARESHSHLFTTVVTEHRAAQTEILQGFYQAQFLGPLCAFLFLKFFSPALALGVDLLSFLMAGAMALNLAGNSAEQIDKRHFLQPLKNLAESIQIRKIFILRTFGFWVPTAVFNVLIIQSSLRPKDAGIEFSALWYSLMGLGAFIGSLLLKRVMAISAKTNGQISCVGNVGFAIICILLAATNSLLIFILAYFFYGVFMGINAIGSQSWRRSVANPLQLPEIIGLEIVIGLSLQLIVAAIYSNFAHRIPHPILTGYGFAACVYLLTASFAKLWDPDSLSSSTRG